MTFPNIPFWRQSKQMQVIRKQGGSKRAIRLNEGYWQLRLVEMRIARDWVFTTMLHPALHLQVNLNDITSQIVIGASQLGAIRGDKRLVHLEPRALTSPIPYSGANCEIGVCLLAIPGKELAEGMLNILGLLSTSLNQPQVAMAASLANILRSGVNTVLGLDTCQMKLGWVAQFNQSELLQQQFIIIAPPNADNWTASTLSIWGGRLMSKTVDITRTSYMVLQVQVATRRSDWRQIPEIRDPLEQVNQAYSTANMPEKVRAGYLEGLIKAIRTSKGLIPAQQVEIVDEIIALKSTLEGQNEALFRANNSNDFAELIDTSLRQKNLVDEFVKDQEGLDDETNEDLQTDISLMRFE